MQRSFTSRSIPLNSLLGRTPEEEEEVLEVLINVPQTLRPLISSPRTGAFIRGTAKQFNLPDEAAEKIAWLVLQIFAGIHTLSKLPLLLQTDLNTTAQVSKQIAIEIERELFAPVVLEFNAYITQHKRAASQTNGMASTLSSGLGGGRNLLDLKQQKSPPLPPPLP